MRRGESSFAPSRLTEAEVRQELEALRAREARLERLIARWRAWADDLEERAKRHYGANWLGDGDRCTERAKERRALAAQVEQVLRETSRRFL